MRSSRLGEPVRIARAFCGTGTSKRTCPPKGDRHFRTNHSTISSRGSIPATLIIRRRSPSEILNPLIEAFSRPEDIGRRPDFTTFIPLTFLLSPLSWEHHLVLLVPVFLVLMHRSIWYAIPFAICFAPKLPGIFLDYGVITAAIFVAWAVQILGKRAQEPPALDQPHPSSLAQSPSS